MRKRLLEKVCIVVIGILILAGVSYALNLSRVKTWGTEILTAADLNAEFDNILDHSITNSDISATAAIVASKIDFTTASAIGSTTPSTGAFTTLSSTGATTLGDASADAITITGTATFSQNTSFGDKNITNVGSIALDSITADGSAITLAGVTITDLGAVTTVDINGGTLDGVNIGTTTATGELIVNNSSDDADGLGSQGTSGQSLISAGAGANPTWSDSLNAIEDYATSASSSTSRTLNNLNICYGTLTIAGNGNQAVTNLPFTNAATYVVMVTFEGTSISLVDNTMATRNSGAQFTVYNGDDSQANIMWVAIGT